MSKDLQVANILRTEVQLIKLGHICLLDLKWITTVLLTISAGLSVIGIQFKLREMDYSKIPPYEWRTFGVRFFNE